MTKKVVISTIVVLLLICGGAFYWRQKGEVKGSPEDYVIKETPEGKFVENKKAGLSVKVPAGWEVKKIDILEGSVVIDSTDIEGQRENGIIKPPLTKGCGMEVSVIYKKMDFDQIKQAVKEIHWGLKTESESFEETTVNNHLALKNTFYSQILGPAITVYIPKGDKVYDFDLYLVPDDSERCIQEFDKFLATVSI